MASSDLPKIIDVCGAEISFNVFSDNKEGLVCDSLQSKSILENAVINNSECTGFFMVAQKGQTKQFTKSQINFSKHKSV